MKKSILFVIISAFNFVASGQNFSGNLPAAGSVFLRNEGQWNEAIKYKGISLHSNVYLLENGLSFSQKENNSDSLPESSFVVWNMKFENTKEGFAIRSMNAEESVYSFFSGNKKENWVIHPESCSSVRYEELYEHIDLKFYANGSQLEYDYVIHPGGRLDDIASSYEGVKNLNINRNGDLEIHTAWDTQIQKAPVSWQIINGVKKQVEIKYILLSDYSFGFAAPDGYDPKWDLVIDPLFEMVWSSYTNITGGNNNINYSYSNAMDAQGNVYLTLMVDGTFPITPGAYSGPGDVFPEIAVAKFSSDGTTLIYWTYIPGNSSEFASDIDVDETGRAFITGRIDLNFTGVTDYPSTPNGFQPIHNAGSDAFITVLNEDSTDIVYSSFLGGNLGDEGYAIECGSDGIAYISGNTSGFGNFPVVDSPTFPTGDLEAFVAKFDINMNGAGSLIYSTRIGAGSFTNSQARGLAINNMGEVFITGYTSTSFNPPIFPTTPGAFQTVYDPDVDGKMSFVTKISNTTPISLVYSTFLAPGIGNSIDVDESTGDAFVTGETNSFLFPVTAGALQSIHAGAGGTDAFCIRLNASGSALVYSTFLGGEWADIGTGVAVNSGGEAYVVGTARETFPTSAGAFQPTFAGGSTDFFIVQLNATGTGYGCGGSTYVGGSSEDYDNVFEEFPAPKVSLLDHGGINDTISVNGTTHSEDFPTTPGVYGPVKLNGINDQPVFFKMTCQSIDVLPEANFEVSDSVFCGSGCISVENQSLHADAYQWSFPGGIPSSSSNADPGIICYDQVGTYQVSLVVSNEVGTDTIHWSAIEVHPYPTEVQLVFSNDSLSFSLENDYESYAWWINGMEALVFGNVLYPLPVASEVSIIVSNEFGCTDTANYFTGGLPPVAAFSVSDSLLCVDDCITMINTTLYANEYHWQFEGGTPSESSLPSPQVCYASPGNFNISLVVHNEDGNDSIMMEDIIHVLTYPSGSMLQHADSILLQVNGNDIISTWDFNGTTLIPDENFVTPVQSGLYTVFITNAAGCEVELNVLGVELVEHFVYIPNTVTCDQDGLNEYWFVEGDRENWMKYQARIFNRWGDLIFETNDPYQPWTGNAYEGDYYVPDGVYVYQVEIEFNDLLETKTYEGHVNLVR